MDFPKKYHELLKSMEKSSIILEIDKAFTGESEIGSSKIGGRPDLPPNFEWFRYEGEHFADDEVAVRPLSFIAQINCAQASTYEKSNLLPKKGMLYFFFDMATNKWGFDPKDKGCAKVFYYSGDISELRRTELPADLSREPYDFHIPEAPINFSVATELPSFEEFMELCDDDIDYKQWEGFNNAKIELGYKIDEEEDWGKSKLLGYADVIQGSMLLECELVTNDIYCGDATGRAKITAEETARYKQNSKQWQLLFQLGSFYIGDYDLMWDDAGSIYFYIKLNDLKKQNFKNCWLILQCS